MEESIKLLDFETHDQMVQIHGAHLLYLLSRGLSPTLTFVQTTTA